MCRRIQQNDGIFHRLTARPEHIIRKPVGILAAVCTLFGFILCVFSKGAIAGSCTADFLQIGSSARITAMGGAGVCAAAEGNSFSWNPGGLFRAKESQLNFHHLIYSRSLAEFNYLGYLACLPRGARIALSWVRFGVDDIPVFPDPDVAGSDYGKSDPSRRLDGDPQGTFNAVDNAFVISFARGSTMLLDMGWLYRPVELEFSFGGNLKYVVQKIWNNQGKGFGVDIGALFGVDLSQLFDLRWLGCIRSGLNVQDIGGTTIRWNTQSRREDDVPRNIRYGMAMTFPFTFMNAELLLSFEGDHGGGRESDERFWGMECAVRKVIFFRVGKTASQYTAGVGFTFWKLKFDYAFVPNDMVNTHRIDIGVFPFR
jgi:hypothetical protein